MFKPRRADSVSHLTAAIDASQTYMEVRHPQAFADMPCYVLIGTNTGEIVKAMGWDHLSRVIIDRAELGSTAATASAATAVKVLSVEDAVELLFNLALPYSTATLTNKTLSGAAVGSGGVTPISAPSGFHNWQPVAATSGTDTTPADGTHFVTSLYVPCNATLTGVGYLIGSVGGTDKVYAALYSSAGALLANSSVAAGGATVGTAANVQALAFTTAYAAKGPDLFYVGISMNGNTARLRTVPAHTQAGLWGNSVAQTHGSVAAITPMTAFTADKAPVCFVYYTPA